MAYRTLMLDCPWGYTTPGWLGGAKRHYPLLPYAALKHIPVPNLAADNAHLWMWSTDQFQEEAFRLIRRWGFIRKATWTWVKLGKKPLTIRKAVRALKKDPLMPLFWYHGQLYRAQYGNGYYGRSVCEYLILAVRGRNLVKESERHQRKLIVSPVREHSEKPDEAYNLVRAYSPGKRLEVFARRDDIPGFDAVGNEACSIYLPQFEAWSGWAQHVFQSPSKVRAA